MPIIQFICFIFDPCYCMSNGTLYLKHLCKKETSAYGRDHTVWWSIFNQKHTKSQRAQVLTESPKGHSAQEFGWPASTVYFCVHLLFLSKFQPHRQECGHESMEDTTWEQRLQALTSPVTTPHHTSTALLSVLHLFTISTLSQIMGLSTYPLH